uniref:Uncharacterized protein n=1 Tax=Timema genevievae TaxID=629358 RepID=A0A7R9K1W4_TIMGE|nr:unnamed protein product [Timema genevievae]
MNQVFAETSNFAKGPGTPEASATFNEEDNSSSRKFKVQGNFTYYDTKDETMDCVPKHLGQAYSAPPTWGGPNERRFHLLQVKLAEDKLKVSLFSLSVTTMPERPPPLSVVGEAASPVLLGPWHHQHRVFTWECKLILQQRASPNLDPVFLPPSATT